MPAQKLVDEFDAVVLTGGAENPRDLPVPGRELDGVHFAMEFLPQQNKVVAGDKVAEQIKATGKHVVVIGGGDTGSDCVGTSNRHGAASVTQFELLPQPPEYENKRMVWPYWPVKLRTSSSHEEGCKRDWAVATKRFEGKGGKVERLVAARVEWKDGKMREVPGSEFDDQGRPGAAGDGVPWSRAGRPAATTGRGEGRPQQRQADTEGNATGLPWARYLLQVICGAASRWWYGRFAKDASVRGAVDEFLMGSTELPR